MLHQLMGDEEMPAGTPFAELTETQIHPDLPPYEQIVEWIKDHGNEGAHRRIVQYLEEKQKVQK